MFIVTPRATTKKRKMQENIAEESIHKIKWDYIIILNWKEGRK